MADAEVERVAPRPVFGGPAASPPRPALQRTPMAGRYAALEPLDPDRHAAALHRQSHGTDAALRIWRYLPDGPWASAAEHAAALRRSAALSDRVYYAIRPLQLGQVAGQAGFLDIRPEHGTIEIGHIWFGPTLQRTQAATEALYLMMRHAADDLGYRRIQWKCDALNAASRAAARRLGFRFEGIHYRHLIVKGRNRDTAWYSILLEEWPAVRRAIERWLAPENFDADGRARTSLSGLTAGSVPDEPADRHP